MISFDIIVNKLFLPVIKRRGLAYKNEDRVYNLEIKGYKVFANVQGKEKYYVNINFEADNINNIELYCSCPYFETANCKHLSAVFYKLRDKDFFNKLNSQFSNDTQLSSSLKENDWENLFINRNENLKTGSSLNEEYKRKIIEAVKRKKEDARFTLFKNKAKRLLSEEKFKKSNRNYTIVYGIKILSYKTVLYAMKQFINKYDYVSKTTRLNSLNPDDFIGLETKEKLILNKFQKNYGELSFPITDSFLLKRSYEYFIERDINSEYLLFLSDKIVYSYDDYDLTDNLVNIHKQAGYCKLLFEETKDFYTLSLKFYIDDKPITIDDGIIPVLDNPLWIKINDDIFHVNNLMYSQLEFFIDNDGRFDIPKDYLFYFEQSILPNIVKEIPLESSIFNIEKVEASVKNILYLEEKENILLLKLKFKYDDFELSYNDNEDFSIVVKDKSIIRIIRDTQKENEVYKKIKATHVKEIQQGIFTPRNDPVNYLLKHFTFFKENDIEVLGENNLSKYKINMSTPSLKFKIVSGIDWFDVQTDILFDGVSVPLEELFKSIKGKNNYIRLNDGSMGILPENWIKKFQRSLIFGNVKNNSVRFSKIQANSVNLLLKDAEDYETDNEFKKYIEKLNDFEKIKPQQPVKDFNGKLRHYQKFGLDWFYFLQEFKFGGILADDMGLGKTIQVLALLAKEKNKQNITSLVVAPTSVVFNWINEAAKFTPSLKILCHTGNRRIKDNPTYFKDFDLILTSYAILRRDQNLFYGFSFNYIILDESQNIKNPSSLIGKIVKNLNANYRLCLTGTPLENSLTELWSQMTFLNPGMFGSLNRFNEAYVKPISKNDETVVEDLRKTVYPFILRRTKDVVAKELPPKTEIVHFCRMQPDQEKIYNIWKDSIRNEILNEINKTGINKPRKINSVATKNHR